MIKPFLEQAARDESVYLTDVRAAFQAEGTRPFHLHVTLYDRSVRVCPLRLPETAGEEEARFAAEYVYATVYNLLSALGGLTGRAVSEDVTARIFARFCVGK